MIKPANRQFNASQTGSVCQNEGTDKDNLVGSTQLVSVNQTARDRVEQKGTEGKEDQVFT